MIESILDALTEPALLLDPVGRVAIANESARDRLGVWVIGQSYVSVLRQPALLAPVEDAFALGQGGSARFTHSSGAVETLFDVRVSPVRGAGGKRQVLLVFRDVSEVQASESMRRDFVANVSHELKTPLTAVSGFIETLEGPARNDAPARDRFLSMMGQEVRRMDRLVSDLLSLSRLEGQSRRRPTTQVDLARVLRDVAATLTLGAETEGVTINVDAEAEATVPGDRDQLTQVFANLLENAIKYGAQPGTVTLHLSPVERDPVIKGPAWRVGVSDEGAGIAPEHIPRLTERFYRVDTGRSREQGGTGLGLAIVKHIVNRHRGRLKIDSEVGRGTEVVVTLPAA
ncbi:ATP-binding protein [Jannaschia pohangensis]|uniref:histidine kinase n=1 Tax=Jannaschia pohangensis TaxID=390807 RepID=A0A1I3GZ28_9RHOB|nr:ATP-binding protein [Jannaschia pohangensis]SFI28567.1 two-component system, OmpR family, phosphate regulon sensor histidine kinase PhoR [Jannaschia pohangensis]